MPEVTSSRYGAFDPLSPPLLPGVFGRTIAVPPVEIAAPLDQVWSVLTDGEAYLQWCPFTRRVEAEWRPGGAVTLHLSWKRPDVRPLGEPRQKQRFTITTWEPKHAVGWATRLPLGMLRAERTQYLEPIGTERCRYHNYDRFAGPLVPIVFTVYRRRIEAGLAAIGAALKVRAESC